MSASTPHPAGATSAHDWHKDGVDSLVEQVRQLSAISKLGSIALPDRQIHLSLGPDVDPILQTAWGLCAGPESPTLNPEMTLKFGLKVHDWVQRDRKIGYGLAAALAAVCTGTTLESYARMLLSMAQTNYNHDSGIVNLDTAHGLLLHQDPERKMTPAWIMADMLVMARFNYFAQFGHPRPYGSFSPIAANIYSKITFGALFLEHREELGDMEPDALAAFVDRAASENADYAQVIAGRILGDILGARGDTSGSLGARQRALDTALASNITTEIGHLRRAVGSTTIATGLQLRRAGDLDGARDAFRRAEMQLEVAAAFEREEGCEYWAALSQYRLGDAQRYFDDLAGNSQDRALTSYTRGRSMLDKHLSTQIVPADRATKKQIFSSFSATALSTAFATGRGRTLLAQMAVDGSATASDLEQELQALRRLDDDMRRAFAQTRGIYHLEMTAVEHGADAYENLIREHHDERLRYYVGKLWTRRRLYRDTEVLVERLAAGLSQGTVIFAIDPCQHESFAAAFDHGVNHLRTARVANLTEPGTAEAQNAFAQALETVKRGHPRPATVIKSALDVLLSGVPPTLVAVANAALAISGDIDRVVLLPYRQLSSFPWQALEINGGPLLERCEVVYGHSIEMLEMLECRPPSEGKAEHTTMIYDDAGADYFEPLSTAGSSIGIQQVLRNPSWEELEALGPLAGAASSSDHDPLYGHVLTYAPLPSDEPPPEEDPPPPRPILQDLFFACHGSFDPLDPLSSGLLLDDQTRTIDFSDVLTKLDLGTWRGVVLGACETGLARRELATEQVSLGSAFLAAGVDYVITSQWPVDRLATAVLFEDFFVRLHGGASYPGALRLAQLALRRLSAESLVAWAEKHLPERYVAVATRRAERSEHPFWHPYYWAGFVVTGRP
jgi:hypothetical protein